MLYCISHLRTHKNQAFFTRWRLDQIELERDLVEFDEVQVAFFHSLPIWMGF